MNLERLNQIDNNLGMTQCYYELLAVCDEVGRLNPKVICEIGVEKGGTLQVWSDLINSTGYLIGIDVQNKVNWNKFDKNNNFVYYIHANSTDSETIESVETFLNDGEISKIDFLWIDGDHTYDGVKSDFINYCNFVRSGGIIGFHDIFCGDGACYFWKEIKREFSHKELHGNDETRIGTGLLYL